MVEYRSGYGLRSAVDVDDDRIFLFWIVINRFQDEAVDLDAVIDDVKDLRLGDVFAF